MGDGGDGGGVGWRKKMGSRFKVNEDELLGK